MKLFGTYPSHFTRKVRVVLQELGLEYQFNVLPSLGEIGVEHFANNPLLQLPTLVHGEREIIESDIICRYLLENFGQKSPELRFLPSSGDKYAHEKRLAVMNGGMAAGVKIIRGKRSNIPNFMEFLLFRQEAAALQSSLKWLDADLGHRTCYQAGEFTLLDITLVSFADWAVFREMIPSLAAFPNLQRFVEANRGRLSLASTHPALEGPVK